MHACLFQETPQLSFDRAPELRPRSSAPDSPSGTFCRPHQDCARPRGPGGEEGLHASPPLPRQARPHAEAHGHLAEGRCAPLHWKQVRVYHSCVVSPKSLGFLLPRCKLLQESLGIIRRNVEFPPRQHLLLLVLSVFLAPSNRGCLAVKIDLPVKQGIELRFYLQIF